MKGAYGWVGEREQIEIVGMNCLLFPKKDRKYNEKPEHIYSQKGKKVVEKIL